MEVGCSPGKPSLLHEDERQRQRRWSTCRAVAAKASASSAQGPQVGGPTCGHLPEVCGRINSDSVSRRH
eukprot:4782912-Prymnesium_polylepis.1